MWKGLGQGNPETLSKHFPDWPHHALFLSALEGWDLCCGSPAGWLRSLWACAFLPPRKWGSPCLCRKGRGRGEELLEGAPVSP